MFKLYNYSLITIFATAVIVFLLLFFVSAPFGKFRRKGWGPAVSAKWAWMIMEFLSPALIVYFFLTAESLSLPGIIFLTGWLIH
jgi:hypothetical protein